MFSWCVYVFFFKQKTAYEMRISDWSSDVCSSDLCAVATEHMRITPGRVILAPGDAHIRVVRLGGGAAIRLDRQRVPSGCMPSVDPMFASVAREIGRASCRERVCHSV